MVAILKILRLSLLLVLAGSSTALANEKMRRDMLARDHDKCLVGCLANNAGAICEMLCGCTIDAFGKLAFEDYVRLNIELNSATVSAENSKLLTETALVCAAEVDRAFPELAIPPAEKSGE
jgi:hypothetical protein